MPKFQWHFFLSLFLCGFPLPTTVLVHAFVSHFTVILSDVSLCVAKYKRLNGSFTQCRSPYLMTVSVRFNSTFTNRVELEAPYRSSEFDGDLTKSELSLWLLVGACHSRRRIQPSTPDRWHRMNCQFPSTQCDGGMFWRSERSFRSLRFAHNLVWTHVC